MGGGQFDNTNPYWWRANPAVYNAVEAAAVLFGGSPSQYAISTIGTNPLTINNLAYVDGWGDPQYLTTPVSQTYKLDLGAPGYNAPGGDGTAYSALVFDHGPSFPNAINYVFRQDAPPTNPVPVPAGMILALSGLPALGFAGWVRRRFTTAA